MTADTYTNALQVTKIATGSYDDTWGEVQNDETIQLFDDAITGQGAINIGTSVTFNMPPLSQGSTAQSRFFSILFTGTPAGPVEIVMPASVTFKFYLIDNQTGQPLTFNYGSSPDTVTVANGEKRLIWCDGTSTWDVLAQATDTSSMNGIPAANWARVSRTASEIAGSTVVTNQFTGIQNGDTYVVVTELPTTILPSAQGNKMQLTLTGNRVMGVPAAPVDGQEIDLLVIQDGTGGRTLTWNAVFLFEGGTPPVLDTAAAGIDRFNMVYNAGLAKWLVGAFLAIAAGSGASTTVTITANTTGFNLLAALGTVVGAITANVNVAKGIVIQSVDGTPAMDLSGLPSGSTVNLTNLGYIIGTGGKGGDGGLASYPGSGATIVSAQPGRAGGNAIVGPGASNTFNITNGNGHIWGGGGGGGGGGAYDGVSGGDGAGNAGGGGGGAGGGPGGKGGGSVYILGGGSSGVDGGNGTSGPSGTNGAAGGGSAAGTALFGTSGAGGTFGVAGVTGAAPSTVVVGHTAVFGAGGAAGKAIELLGAGAPTFISGGSAPNVLGAVS